MEGAAETRASGPAFAEVLAAISATGAATPSADNPELAETARRIASSLGVLAPGCSPMPPRKAQPRDIAAILGEALKDGAFAAFDSAGSRLVALPLADARQAALLLCGARLEPQGEAGPSAPTPLEAALAQLLIGHCAAALGFEPSARDTPDTLRPPDDPSHWQGIALALADARGRGGAPAIWCLTRRDAVHDTGQRETPAPSDVRRRLAFAEVPVTHALRLAPRPFAAIRTLAQGDVIELGIAGRITATGQAQGRPVHEALIDVRGDRLVARITALHTQMESGSRDD
jgi:hypothetical protein